ncbi:hypothetical protein Dthio_PD0438 [Desulfonatronospira thiodismutans ASO3-1]|uniref:Uncharacterized protein n=1 Tax=Desulfonatronospira thiodismutans ASO3-1 TaxID=555779 RepID=D6SU32_9BACT|nr:hypothetical protein Dthio_PD0438 [Desulfonatronospira thiodismutans ASO3-1]
MTTADCLVLKEEVMFVEILALAVIMFVIYIAFFEK